MLGGRSTLLERLDLLANQRRRVRELLRARGRRAESEVAVDLERPRELVEAGAQPGRAAAREGSSGARVSSDRASAASAWIWPVTTEPSARTASSATRAAPGEVARAGRTTRRRRPAASPDEEPDQEPQQRERPRGRSSPTACRSRRTARPPPSSRVGVGSAAVVGGSVGAGSVVSRAVSVSRLGLRLGLGLGLGLGRAVAVGVGLDRRARPSASVDGRRRHRRRRTGSESSTSGRRQQSRPAASPSRPSGSSARCRRRLRRLRAGSRRRPRRRDRGRRRQAGAELADGSAMRPKSHTSAAGRRTIPIG